jgi:hypothetical protein
MRVDNSILRFRAHRDPRVEYPNKSIGALPNIYLTNCAAAAFVGTESVGYSPFGRWKQVPDNVETEVLSVC